jgi:tRNA A37 threonylcarbamoyltransferase TsaD
LENLYQDKASTCFHTGGQLIEILAQRGNPNHYPSIKLPKSSEPNGIGCDMTFSGFLTSAQSILQKEEEELTFASLCHLSATIQKICFDQIRSQTHRAFEFIDERGVIRLNAINLCGGVSCNKVLQNEIK